VWVGKADTLGVWVGKVRIRAAWVDKACIRGAAVADIEAAHPAVVVHPPGFLAVKAHPPAAPVAEIRYSAARAFPESLGGRVLLTSTAAWELPVEQQPQASARHQIAYRSLCKISRLFWIRIRNFYRA